MFVFQKKKKKKKKKVFCKPDNGIVTQLTIAQQLDLGVRALELELHFIQEFA
jgi:hypothetical protein